jgi:hypothetical protein
VANYRLQVCREAKFLKTVKIIPLHYTSLKW